MMPNPKYKTSLCKYWESSKLSRHALSSRTEVPLRPRTSGIPQDGRRLINSPSCTTSCFPPSPSSTTTRPTPTTRPSSANTLTSARVRTATSAHSLMEKLIFVPAPNSQVTTLPNRAIIRTYRKGTKLLPFQPSTKARSSSTSLVSSSRDYTNSTQPTRLFSTT